MYKFEGKGEVLRQQSDGVWDSKFQYAWMYPFLLIYFNIIQIELLNIIYLVNTIDN